MATESDPKSGTAAAGDVVHILGQMPDARIAAILSTGATIAQLEEAAAWAAGENDVMGDMRRPITGPVAAVYEILTADEAFAEERN
jgi:hypothetical protein